MENKIFHTTALVGRGQGTVDTGTAAASGEQSQSGQAGQQAGYKNFHCVLFFDVVGLT
jgi:hypothetical protein